MDPVNCPIGTALLSPNTISKKDEVASRNTFNSLIPAMEADLAMVVIMATTVEAAMAIMAMVASSAETTKLVIMALESAAGSETETIEVATTLARTTTCWA